MYMFKIQSLSIVFALATAVANAQLTSCLRLDYEARLGLHGAQYASGPYQLLVGGEEANGSFPSYTEGSRTGSADADGTISLIYGDPEKRLLYTDLDRGIISWKTSYAGNPKNGTWTILTDTLPVIDWVLSDSVRVSEALGLNTRKATASWAGREYEAWYAPSLPIRLGPYKFHGLPGAIVSLRSLDEKVAFELTRYAPGVQQRHH